MRFQFVAAVILGLILSPAPAFGCTCAPPPPEIKTASELTAWTKADAIFEGKVESVELRWKLKEAQIGDVIPTAATDLDQDGPVILVSLEVLHSYRGDQQEFMRLSTGLGGGHCVFDIKVGNRYLVYAFKDEAGELSTSNLHRNSTVGREPHEFSLSSRESCGASGEQRSVDEDKQAVRPSRSD